MQVTKTFSTDGVFPADANKAASDDEAAFPAPGIGDRPTEQRRERTREQILEAAFFALVRIGYENITTRCIAKEAGVNVATLHYYFGTKEALLSATVRHALRVAEQRLRAAIADAPDASSALEAMFQETWRIVRERAGVLRYDLAVRGLRDPKARQDATALYDALRALTREVIQWHLQTGGTLAPGVTPELLAHYLVATVDGILLQHMVSGNDETTAHCLNLIKQNALGMMGSGAAGSDFAIAGAHAKPATPRGPKEETE